MEPTISLQKNFPVCESTIQNPVLGTHYEWGTYWEILVNNMSFIIMKTLKKIPMHVLIKSPISISEDISRISVEQYMALSNDFKIIKRDSFEISLFNFVFIEFSYDTNILAKALVEIHSNPLKGGRFSPIHRCIDKVYKNFDGINQEKEFDKCKFFIESGEDVNLGCDTRELTPLELALWDLQLDNSFTKLFLEAGGIVYKPWLLEDHQDRVNSIMQPHIDKINVIIELVIAKSSFFQIFPIELKILIGSIAIDSLNLAPKVALKILALNKSF